MTTACEGVQSQNGCHGGQGAVIKGWKVPNQAPQYDREDFFQKTAPSRHQDKNLQVLLKHLLLKYGQGKPVLAIGFEMF